MLPVYEVLCLTGGAEVYDPLDSSSGDEDLLSSPVGPRGPLAQTTPPQPPPHIPAIAWMRTPGTWARHNPPQAPPPPPTPLHPVVGLRMVTSAFSWSQKRFADYRTHSGIER